MTSENNWFGEVLGGQDVRERGPGRTYRASSALPKIQTRVFGFAVGANLRPDSAQPGPGPWP